MDAQEDARTAKAPISAATWGTPSATTAAEVGATRQAQASICMWLVRKYMADLESFFCGDDARFNRMVVDGGKGIPNANPQGWTKLIMKNLADDGVQALHGDEVAQCKQRLAEWGLITISTSESETMK